MPASTGRPVCTSCARAWPAAAKVHAVSAGQLCSTLDALQCTHRPPPQPKYTQLTILQIGFTTPLHPLLLLLLLWPQSELQPTFHHERPVETRDDENCAAHAMTITQSPDIRSPVIIHIYTSNLVESNFGDW